MRAKKVDRNHAEIRDALRQAGYLVYDVHDLPGRLDLDVLSKAQMVSVGGARVGLVVALEVKMPGEGLTEKEAEYLSEWPGAIVRSVEEALELMSKIDDIRLLSVPGDEGLELM